MRLSATLLASSLSLIGPSHGLVWPTPAHVDASGANLALHPDFSLAAELGLADETRDEATPAASSRLHRTIARMGRVVDQLALEVRAARGG
eukprot:COSAG06_NODE_35896_length_454_cov_0.895775_1_plen_90_part_10